MKKGKAPSSHSISSLLICASNKTIVARVPQARLNITAAAAVDADRKERNCLKMLERQLRSTPIPATIIRRSVS